MIFKEGIGVEMEDAQGVGVPKIFERTSAEEMEGEAWKCVDSWLVINFLRKERIEDTTLDKL